MRVEAGSLVVGFGSTIAGLGGAVPSTQHNKRLASDARAGTPPASHRRAITLAGMYQRIPNNMLEKVEGKVPSSYSVLRIPWREDGRHMLSGVSKGKGDIKFAVWETQGLLKGSTLEETLFRIEVENGTMARVLKYQIAFQDGSRMTFERKDISDPESLVCRGFYSVPKAPASETKPKKFLVSSNGHLINRKKSEEGSNSLTASLHTAQRDQAFTVRSKGFNFTPLGFIRHEVRPNTNKPGIRPGLRETSSQATQFRPRPTLSAKQPSVASSLRGSKPAPPMTDPSEPPAPSPAEP